MFLKRYFSLHGKWPQLILGRIYCSVSNGWSHLIIAQSVMFCQFCPISLPDGTDPRQYYYDKCDHYINRGPPGQSCHYYFHPRTSRGSALVCARSNKNLYISVILWEERRSKIKERVDNYDVYLITRLFSSHIESDVPTMGLRLYKKETRGVTPLTGEGPCLAVWTELTLRAGDWAWTPMSGLALSVRWLGAAGNAVIHTIKPP